MVSRTVLTRSGPITLNTVRPVNTVQPRTTMNNAGSLKNVINNAYSTARRPFFKITTTNNSNFTKKVNTDKVTAVNTAKPKAVVNIVRQKVVLSAVKGNMGNVVNASACWVWKPKTKVIDHVSKHNSASMLFIRFDYVDAQGRSKLYLTDYEEIDGGFVAFGGNSKGGKITGKGKIKTGKLDFEDVYFVKELKFNLFSVSQMCNKKNSVLFTDIACVVLSPDFKLTDESHVLLKVPRKDNMYSVDLKNVVPQGGINLLLLVKLMLPGITYYCWATAGSVNAVRLNLVLLVQATAKAKTLNREVQIQSLVDKKKVIITKTSVRSNLQLEDAEEPVTNDTENVTSVPTHSNDPLLSSEDRLKLNELMELCTSLSQRVLDFEKIKTSQAAEISELKQSIKRLEKKRGSRTHRLKILYKVGRSARVVSSKDEGLGDQEDPN
ncbi:hypothetical protein Tco_0378599, partial [Tanacetum coccineum]